jgi:hypothetical protein
MSPRLAVGSDQWTTHWAFLVPRRVGVAPLLVAEHISRFMRVAGVAGCDAGLDGRCGDVD